MITSTFIDTELSKEDFFKAISTHKANLIAPLTFKIAPDVYGCQPDIYDPSETANVDNFLKDSIILSGVKRYSGKNDDTLLALVRHDMYIRPPTAAEAKIYLRNKSGIVDVKELERFKWNGSAESEGILIKDIDGEVYDFPCKHKWEKSLLHTAVAPINSTSSFYSVVAPMFDGVNQLGYMMHKKSPNANLQMIRCDYALFSVKPSMVTYCPISEIEYREGSVNAISLDPQFRIVIGKSMDLLEERLGKSSIIMHEELKSFDTNVVSGEHLSSNKLYNFNRRKN